MKYGAEENSNVGPAPVGDVRWRVTHKSSGKSVVVVCHAWVEARDRGSRDLRCDRYEVTAALVPDEDTP